MKLLKNKIFALIVCLISFSIFGLVFTDRVLGVTVKSNVDMYYGKIINLGAPTNSSDATTKSYVDSVSLPWSKLTSFPSSCSSGQYVSGVGSSLTCSAPSSLWSHLTSFPSSCSSGQYVSGVGSSLVCTALPAASNSWTLSGSNIYSNNTGNVGIGNSSPPYKLDVWGSTRLNGPVGINTDPNSSYPLNVYGNSYLNGYLGINTTPNSSYPLNVSGNSYLNGYVGVGTSPNSSYRLNVSGNSYLNGYVGIGTTPNSSYRLYVYGDSYLGGYVGINTVPSTSYPLNVYGNSYLNGGVGIGTAPSGTYKLNVLGNTNLLGNVNIGTIPSGSYRLYVNGDSYLNGSLGVGTSPNSSYRLNVLGNSYFGGSIGINTTPNSSYPLNVSGNSYLNGYVGIGTTPSSSYKLYVSGNTYVAGTFYASTKNFVIDHPLDPENKKLVHSSLEGPEIAVFYRGEAQLQNGKAVVELPSYFEALTRKENRTVLLTPKFDSNEPVSNLAASAVENGKFNIRVIDQNNLNQKFYWEVKAVRADVAPLEVERLKADEK